MSHPLFDLARKLDRRHRLKRRQLVLDNALSDRHIARDLGLEHRVRRHRLTDY